MRYLVAAQPDGMLNSSFHSCLWVAICLALVTHSGAISAHGIFEPGNCPFLPDPNANYHVDCGTVIVPENRARTSEGRAVRLAVAIVRAADRHPEADPVVFLDGGPGLRSLDVLTLRMRIIQSSVACIKSAI